LYFFNRKYTADTDKYPLPRSERTLSAGTITMLLTIRGYPADTPQKRRFYRT